MRIVLIIWFTLLLSVFFVGYLFYGVDGIIRGIASTFEKKNGVGIAILLGLTLVSTKAITGIPFFIASLMLRYFVFSLIMLFLSTTYYLLILRKLIR